MLCARHSLPPENFSANNNSTRLIIDWKMIGGSGWFFAGNVPTQWSTETQHIRMAIMGESGWLRLSQLKLKLTITTKTQITLEHF